MPRNRKNEPPRQQIKILNDDSVKLEDSSLAPKTDKSPDNLFQLSLSLLSKIDRRVSGVLIAVIVICGVLFFIWNQFPEQIKVSILNRLLFDSVGNASLYPGIEVVKSTQSFDFAEWTPPPIGDPSNCCKVTTEEKMTIRRIRKDATSLARRAGTFAKLIDFKSGTHDISRRESLYQRMGGIFMSHFDVLLDISNEPLDTPFNANLRSARYGTFVEPHEWAAVNVFQPTREVTLELKFQESKRAGNLVFSSSMEIDKKNSIELKPIQVDSLESMAEEMPSAGAYEIKGNIVRWTIRSPVIGHCYRIDWDW